MNVPSAASSQLDDLDIGQTVPFGFSRMNVLSSDRVCKRRCGLAGAMREVEHLQPDVVPQTHKQSAISATAKIMIESTAADPAADTTTLEQVAAGRPDAGRSRPGRGRRGGDRPDHVARRGNGREPTRR